MKDCKEYIIIRNSMIALMKRTSDTEIIIKMREILDIANKNIEKNNPQKKKGG